MSGPNTRGEKAYDIAEAQQFLNNVGQFTQENVHSELARNLLGLKLIWGFIDRRISTAPTGGTDATSERVYSGFSESGNYFEIYGSPLHFEDDTLYPGHLGFHADLTTGNIAPIKPDVYMGEGFMQLRFFPEARLPNSSLRELADDMGRARLTIGTALKLPPEDFHYYQGYAGEKRQVLLDTEAFQERTGLYDKEPRTCIYQPDPSYYNENQGSGVQSLDF